MSYDDRKIKGLENLHFKVGAISKERIIARFIISILITIIMTFVLYIAIDPDWWAFYMGFFGTIVSLFLLFSNR